MKKSIGSLLKEMIRRFFWFREIPLYW